MKHKSACWTWLMKNFNKVEKMDVRRRKIDNEQNKNLLLVVNVWYVTPVSLLHNNLFRIGWFFLNDLDETGLPDKGSSLRERERERPTYLFGSFVIGRLHSVDDIPFLSVRKSDILIGSNDAFLACCEGNSLPHVRFFG
ncbi:hypothetical protein M5K25_017603 [Dendrobium thyrsiflorum]|uniref:Uncharacterized protein n=1 Tax=Dendrobium thyrsiflorum TaxID=117978 RepID=A0ABD0UMZ5_DENTH